MTACHRYVLKNVLGIKQNKKKEKVNKSEEMLLANAVQREVPSERRKYQADMLFPNTMCTYLKLQDSQDDCLQISREENKKKRLKKLRRQ